MEIREYRPGDCPEMARLFYDTVHAVCAGDYAPEQLAVWATGVVDQRVWDESFRASHTLVAVQQGQIVGFGNMDAGGYLDYLYVHRDFQRRGIASALCDALERQFPGRRLTTHASTTALPFFLSRGWRIVREQEVVRHGVALRNYVMEKLPAESVESEKAK